MDRVDIKRVIETALICHQQPLAVSDLRTLFAGEVDAQAVQDALHDLQGDWTGRGAELVQVATGWRLQSRIEMQPYLERLRPEKALKYSRAVLETLAIIAYRQPVTRGDIEDIRGVVINSSLVKQLEDRGWIETVGHRETVGRPALLATTRQFLDDLGIRSLEDLPALEGQVEPLSALLQAEAPVEMKQELDSQPSPEPDPVADVSVDAELFALAESA